MGTIAAVVQCASGSTYIAIILGFQRYSKPNKRNLLQDKKVVE